ncbi:5-methyltetrahydropteroyltriglutamate--homocysteine S-methyltransferase [Rheinheimera sp.]|uniref:5-methyltetrahydropteroyltriglutamate-- homocysteine S-methyltransferase n=1 Tax=Rheinheimera sp. TaxID=1869214 RepID=UPI0027B972A6|nr:5-methyltetrahydropteroyltriglutamate--homocysteine S-methyltransferase [Rheinheimera sp.]
MSTTHSLGFPRIGNKRQLKRALEQYWQGEISQEQLQNIGAQLRADHWQLQQQAGIDLVPVGDFAYYDHVLNTSLLFGVVPKRHQTADGQIDFDCQFRIGRGRAPTGPAAAASDMTKWFNTNYHYLVPEFDARQQFSLTDLSLFNQINEAKALGLNFKLVLPGPVTYLHCGKVAEGVDKLNLLPALLKGYQQLLDALNAAGVQWLQLDEPVLALELSADWLSAIQTSYRSLQKGQLKLLLTSYFGDISAYLPQLVDLPFDGIHLDLCAEPVDLTKVAALIPSHWVLSAGIINGRNIWRADLSKAYQELKPLFAQKGDKLWLGTSCSLLHSPVDLTLEKQLEPEIRSWFAFARQKCEELKLLQQALKSDDTSAIEHYSAPVKARAHSTLVHKAQVQQACAKAKTEKSDRSLPFASRINIQQLKLQLPLLPTTTIGSFPQTPDIRKLRVDLKAGRINEQQYQQHIQQQIAKAVQLQEELGLDVLVHGEAERNDMVEYFGEQLQGYVFTQFGWVQSYGSRCVKPPVIVGDISRPKDMTVRWTAYAQSLTKKPMKGMLTGPVTMLAWSFPREDLSRADIALQLSLALADEVKALEQAGIQIIQIDEPAFREGLPLKRSQWQQYLNWAVDTFKRCSTHINSSTQIHTHMCYSEFNDIIGAIAAMDADVITIETSRSNMELLQAFEDFAYPNQIGPGVYDIHSPNVPDLDWIKQLIHKAAGKLPVQQLWVNPDCGLKTRGWPETEAALKHMVQACRELRQELA